ncbi:MAG: CHAT domain-containing protein, partial [Rubrivivax sp.]|nr:CHAT domain-containing protein [Rubrivivax sp.]
QVLAASAGVPAGPPDSRGAAPLQVTVLNGNLSFVRGTLMVGHSRALQLTGTEAVVNKLVGGAMQDSLHAGLYPNAPGSHQLFVNANADPVNPWRAPQPASVVVVGLGEEGKLGERELTRTVRQGVLAWVQRMQEGSLAVGTQAAASMPQPLLELTATLMGSGGAGIYASNAARAVALGVREANRRLAALGRTGWPRVGHLTLVELYLERASDAWQGLQVLGHASPDEFAITPTIQSGVGPLRRQIDSGYRGTDYDLITATGQGADTIAFRLDTKRARTEVNAQSTQGKLLRELVRRASTEANNDPQLGRTLFQLLVPLEVEPFLAGTSRMLLELDATTAAIPWEMLDTRSAEQTRQPDAGQAAVPDEQPWAIRTRLLRKLQTENYRQHVQDARVDDAVLVIGEPQVDPDKYVALPGARAEAEAVRDALLGSGGLAPERVKALIGSDDATTIINALFENCYRIVHIAGHGEPIHRDAQGKVPELGGVVLSEGTYLGPQEIRAMRTVPELVFVNCCHLAARDADQTLRGGSQQPDKDKFNRAEFAMGVADALIAIGVRCVIAAGWAVDDGPAKIFADTFYRAILARRPFIDAVAQAREAAWLADRGSNTWAAYQAYGDPDWVYRKGPQDTMAVAASHSEQFDGIASPLGLTLALEEQAVRVRWMHADRQGQLDNVRLLQKRFGALWGGMGAVAEAFGLAYAEGGAVDDAIGWYERALRANDASASMKAHEQLGNLRARRGAHWGRQTAAGAASAAGKATLQRGIDEVTAALRTLQSLAGLQPTLERLSLCGSAWKRLAMLQRRAGNKQQEQAAWRMALQSYSEAEALGRTGADADLFYPLINRLTLTWMTDGVRGRVKGRVKGGVKGSIKGRVQGRVENGLTGATADGLTENKRGDSSRGWPGFEPRDIEAAQTALRNKTQQEPDFWSVAGLIELDLLLALADGRLADEQLRLQARFGELHTRVAAPWAWESVADQSDMVLGAVPPGAAPAERQAAAALAALIRGFAPLQGGG